MSRVYADRTAASRTAAVRNNSAAGGRLLVVGDSLGVGQQGTRKVDPFDAGGVMAEADRWTYKLQQYLNSTYGGWSYINRSVGTQSSTTLLTTTYLETWKYLAVNAAILETGINNNDLTDVTVWVDDTTGAVNHLHNVLRVPLQSILILSLPPHGTAHYGKPDPTDWNNLLAFNATIRSTVAALGCRLIEMENVYDADDSYAYSSYVPGSAHYDVEADANGYFFDTALHVNPTGANMWYLHVKRQLPNLAVRNAA